MISRFFSYKSVIKQSFSFMLFCILTQQVYSQTELKVDPQISDDYNPTMSLTTDSLLLLSPPLLRIDGLSSYSMIQAKELLKIKIQVPEFSYYQRSANLPFVENFIQSPFISTYSINSIANYRISDKLSLTGSRFSASSVFGVQLPDPTTKMNIQGVNLHLEYKISDKFRIGGGIQIYQQDNGM